MWVHRPLPHARRVRDERFDGEADIDQFADDVDTPPPAQHPAGRWRIERVPSCYLVDSHIAPRALQWKVQPSNEIGANRSC
jgi:hypothetical protein